MKFLTGLAGTLFGIAYFILGIVALLAIMDGVQDLLGIGAFLSAIVAFFVVYIPIVGTALGIWGAIEAWGWEWYWAAALFVGPFVVIMVFSALATGAEATRYKIAKRKRRRDGDDLK